MSFFTDEILEYSEIAPLLLEDSALQEKGRAIAEEIIRAQDYVHAEPGMLQLAVLNSLADYALRVNTARGISREITLATLKDVNIWIGNYIAVNGRPGLGEMNWLVHHYLGGLFRLGRLQFVHCRNRNKVPSGDYMIETHIPQGEPLDFDACMASFAAAKKFFAELFPNEPAEYFFCGSWLLSPGIESIAAEGSNILKFNRLWTLIPCEGDRSAQAIERVFGFDFDPANVANAPENTSLQRRLKAHLLAGGSVESAEGFYRH